MIADRVPRLPVLSAVAEDARFDATLQQHGRVALTRAATRRGTSTGSARGTFDGSIAALRRLNELGYDRAGSDLRLDLVYNPLGPSLPPAQRELEHDDKRELGDRFPDPSRLFNSSLEGNARRAIDIHEGEKVDAGAFKALVKAAVAQNGPPAKKR